MKILLLEDDMLLNEAILKFLTLKGHNVDPLFNGEEALEIIKNTCYDLLILDINVPKLSGLAMLEILHNDKIQIPTIFISAIIDIDDISHAFELGCHDYLKKPFHLKELDLRIDKLLHSAFLPKNHLRLSLNYSLDVEKEILTFKGEAQTLSARHLKIIILLANNRNRVVDYYLFQEYVWDNIEVETPTIRAEINRLKKLLKEDIIVNIRNMGYMVKRP